MTHNAILLIGPTGSGKTPLGKLLEKRGLWGRRCAHFDFGENLRRVAEGKWASSILSRTELRVITDSLKKGTLLDNESFPIALKLLDLFVREEGVRQGDFLIMNGLPRHIGQAVDISKFVEVVLVIHLDCSLTTVTDRIQKNAGGDRSGRIDDSPEDIRRKLDLFKERTLPLVNYYQSNGVKVERIEVNVDSTAEDIYEALNLSN